MADSYYPPDDEQAEAAPDETDGAPPTPDKDEQSAGETALLPKSILGGKEFKPGEEVVLQIVHEYGDEVEVAYATGKDGSNENKQADTPEMAGAMGKLNSMAEAGA